MFQIVVLAVLVTAPAQTMSLEDTAQLRRYSDLNEDLHRILRQEATADTPTERAEAVRDLCRLFRELKRDPRLESSDTLKKYHAKAWNRLVNIQRDLQRKLQREMRDVADNSQAQQAALEEATDYLASQMTVMNEMAGGPAYLFQQSGVALGGGMVMDHGQELIQLIERTIKPDFWDTNGGPGSIFYYRPLMALVVSATSEVHGNVGGLLGAMRQAGP